MILNNTLQKLHSKMHNLVSWLQKSEFENDVKLINYEGCHRMTCGSLEATIDVFDVKSIAHTFTLAEKIRGKINGSESAGRICEMMFNDNVVTTSHSVVMRLAVEVLDNFTGSNIYPKVKKKICVAASKMYKAALFF